MSDGLERRTSSGPALVMFAVRRALSRPDRLREVLAELAARGKLPAEDAEKGLDFLLHEGRRRVVA